jgi:tRNA-Thr(GGU) m(6)t(6)A37 methyltransferase TsaA
MECRLEPIGVVRSPHRAPDQTPIQPHFARGARGSAVIDRQYAEGLSDLEGFTHLWLLTWLHLAGEKSLIVKPFLDDTPRGVFATRSPRRPNPIGLSLVRLLSIEKNVLHLEDLDMVDGTPLLDIKPHVPDFDCGRDVRCGWYEAVDKKAAEIRGRRAGDPG